MLSLRLQYVGTPLLEAAYEEAGERGGPPVVLLHGFPGDVRTWDNAALIIVFPSNVEGYPRATA
jgi:pimeloyl-ACP methyl ester carboxylesterase